MDTSTLINLIERRMSTNPGLHEKLRSLPVFVAKINGTKFREIIGVDLRTDAIWGERVVLIYEDANLKTQETE